MKKDGLLIWSGGLDSTSLLFHLRSQEKNIQTVHFTYGAKHNHREIMAVEKMSNLFDIPVLHIQLDFIGKMFSSNLLVSGDPIPSGHYEDESMKQTVVPFRNGIMLSVAAGLAESMDIDTVYIGAHAGDHTIYPDCRPQFIDAMNNAIGFGTWKNIQLSAPFSNCDKMDIVRLGYAAYAPLEMTWTCYKGMELHCGQCGACIERKEAFQRNRLHDPTIYEVEDVKPAPQNLSVNGITEEKGLAKYDKRSSVGF